MSKKTVELWVAMNEDGDHVVTLDETEAVELLGNEAGGYAARVVKVTVLMSPPTIDEAKVEIPDEAGSVEAMVEAETQAA